jgi:hypothetical protein
MTNENVFDIGGMHVEIFLSSQKVDKKGLRIARLSHGSKIVFIQSGSEDLTDCDAMVTKNHEFPLGIKTADCAPICFSDGTKIGIAHVGWRGLCLGLTEKMLAQFDAGKCFVYVGPFLNFFEIKKDFCYDQITQKFGERFITQEGDKLVFNFKEAIASLLPRQTMYDVRNTATELSLPSYRRGKMAERLVTTVSFA